MREPDQITGSENTIDARDIKARLDWLESE